MSKSKGNSIDPLEMIDKYGADAFRFTLAAFSAQGRDVRMSEERIEGYKFFVNKIWNAARFSLMNIEDYEEQLPVERGVSLPDRWILSRLNRTIRETTRSLDEYKFNEAAGGVYQFIWHELCDWYLELSKPVLYARDNPSARRISQGVLFHTLRTSLQLLHPFMPFVTEEIWHTLVGDETSIMVSSFPVPEEADDAPEVEERMGLVMGVVTRIRNIRGEMGIAPSKRLRVLVEAPEETPRSILTEGAGYIANLANLDSLSIAQVVEEPKGAATGVIGATRVFVLLEGSIDVAAERARLEKDLARVEKDLAVVSRKLSNPDFRAKAAEAVVRKEEDKHRELMERQTVIEKALDKIGELDGGCKDGGV